MFYGKEKGNVQNYSIVNEFKNKGYITCGSSNQCHRELFLLKKFTNYKFAGFEHENFALFCDPNFNSPNNKNQLEFILKLENVYIIKIHLIMFLNMEKNF